MSTPHLPGPNLRHRHSVCTSSFSVPVWGWGVSTYIWESEIRLIQTETVSLPSEKKISKAILHCKRAGIVLQALFLTQPLLGSLSKAQLLLLCVRGSPDIFRAGIMCLSQSFSTSLGKAHCQRRSSSSGKQGGNSTRSIQGTTDPFRPRAGTPASSTGDDGRSRQEESPHAPPRVT